MHTCLLDRDRDRCSLYTLLIKQHFLIRKIYYLEDSDAELIKRISKALSTKKRKVSEGEVLRTLIRMVPYKGDTLKAAVKNQL